MLGSGQSERFLMYYMSVCVCVYVCIYMCVCVCVFLHQQRFYRYALAPSLSFDGKVNNILPLLTCLSVWVFLLTVFLRFSSSFFLGNITRLCVLARADACVLLMMIQSSVGAFFRNIRSKNVLTMGIDTPGIIKLTFLLIIWLLDFLCLCFWSQIIFFNLFIYFLNFWLLIYWCIVLCRLIRILGGDVWDCLPRSRQYSTR